MQFPHDRRFVAAISERLEQRKLLSTTRYFPTSLVLDDGGSGGVTLHADFNADGHEDIVRAKLHADGQQYELWLYYNTGSDHLAYEDAIVLQPDTPLYRSNIVAGDFNGDGRNDIVVTTNLIGGEEFRQYNFWGAPGGFTQEILPDAPGQGTAIAAADFDGDGRDDILLENYGSELSIRSFTATGWTDLQPLTVTSEQHVLVQDFNTDGVPDLATLESGTLSVHLQTTPLNFETVASIGLGNVWQIGVGDFNGDANADLAAMSYVPSDYLGNTLIEHIFFNGVDQLQIGGSNLIEDSNPTGFTTVDFDGDGRDDVLLSSGEGPYFPEAKPVLRFLRTGPTGDITVEDQTGMAPPGAGLPVDVDGDGDLDLLHNGGGIAFIENLGGAFRKQPVIDHGQDFFMPNQIVTADFDRDGREDILGYANGWSFLFRGDDDGEFQPPIQQYWQAELTMVTGDFDGDGWIDVASYKPGVGVQLHLNDQTGAFVFGGELALGRLGHLEAADVDGDGVDEIIATQLADNERIAVVRFTDGNLVEVSSFIGDFLRVIPGDFNGDGRIDLIAIDESSPIGGPYGSVLRNAGNFAFEFYQPIFFQDYYNTVVVEDFNTDGLDDVAVGYSFDRAVEIRLNSPEGFGAPAQQFVHAGETTALAEGDYNNDGVTDLAYVTDRGEGGVLIGVAGGSFERQQLFYTAYAPQNLQSIDLDNTGLDSLVFFNQLGPDFHILPNLTDNAAPLVENTAYDFDKAATLPTVEVRFNEAVLVTDAANWTLENRSISQQIAFNATAVSADTFVLGDFQSPSGLLPDGNYRLTIPAGSVAGDAGDALAEDFTFDFFVLAGDANRDRSVDLADFLILRENFNVTLAGDDDDNQGRLFA